MTVEDNKIRAVRKSTPSALRPIDAIMKMLSEGCYPESIQLLPRDLGIPSFISISAWL